MEKFKVCGPSRLVGEVSISGAKNAALPIFCASLLTSEPVLISNVPDLKDVSTMFTLLRKLGVEIDVDKRNNFCEIEAKSVTSTEAPYDLVKTMRASILVLGPLLAKYGEAKVSLPGGCAIGQRPVDQHIKGLRLMGAEIIIESGYIKAKAKKLVGAKIVNDVVTVTGTENLMMAACLADGITVLENAAQEPEIVDLANLLRSMGANISGDGTTKIEITGKQKLKGASHKIIFDRIEAGTFSCAVAACGGDIFLSGAFRDPMELILEKLRECGGEIFEEKSGIRIKFFDRPTSVSFQTSPFPGFATDMQAQFMAVNSVANGIATIKESIFENRFMHVQEMLRLGAKISVRGNTSVVTGVDFLRGTSVMATDLRASAGLVIAAMAAKGNSTIDRIYHLDRGYEKMDKKLNALGASVERVGN